MFRIESLNLQRPPSIGCKSLFSLQRSTYKWRDAKNPSKTSLQHQQWRVYGRPEIFPYKFRHFCESCGGGSGMIWCEACDGEGYYITDPGKAGHPYKQGTARCKTCNGIGVMPCPLCGGQEVRLRPPDPDNGPEGVESDLSIYDWLAQFGA